MAYNNNYQPYSGYGGGGGGGYNEPSHTAYGAQGGADGGGFMAGSQGGSQGAKYQNNRDTVRPLTIMQINEAVQPHPDAEISVDGVELGQVTFVGQVRNVVKQSIYMTYRLDDGTGVIEIRQFFDVDAQTVDEFGNSVHPVKPELNVGDWCRVFGNIKPFNNKRNVSAKIIKRITDFNEIQYHMLEACYVHLYFTRGPPGELNGAGGQQQGQDAGYGQDQQGKPVGDPRKANLSQNARKVLDYIDRTEQTHEGLHMQNIAQGLQMDLIDLKSAGHELLQNNLIFATLDDETWALLEGT